MQVPCQRVKTPHVAGISSSMRIGIQKIKKVAGDIIIIKKENKKEGCKTSHIFPFLIHHCCDSPTNALEVRLLAGQVRPTSYKAFQPLPATKYAGLGNSRPVTFSSLDAFQERRQEKQEGVVARGIKQATSLSSIKQKRKKGEARKGGKKEP